MRPTTGSSVSTPSAVHTSPALIAPSATARSVDSSHAQAVDYIVDELFFTVGQAIGPRKTLDYDVVVWWRDHYRAAFLRAMARFGNRWSADRQVVGAVALLLAERAVRHAGAHPSITLGSAQKATADVQRYCTLHNGRRTRAAAQSGTEGALPMLAGYWCVEDPPPPAPLV